MKNKVLFFIIMALLITVLPINLNSAKAAYTDLDAGNSMDDATDLINLNVDYVSSLSNSGENGWFKFTTGKSPAYYNFYVKNISLADYNYYYYGLEAILYNSVGEILISYHVGENYDNNQDIKLEENSTYYLRFYSSEKAAAIGNYRFNVSYTLDKEYDTKEESSKIKLNKKYTSSLDGQGSINETGDIDWVKFTTEKVQKYTLYVKNLSIPKYNYYHSGLYAIVYSEYDEKIADIELDSNYAKSIELELNSNTTYYIEFYSPSGNKGNYSYSISGPSITQAKITLSKTTYVYDGTVKTPKITVKLDGVTLKNGDDYTIKYTNNKKMGKATVNITGKGVYSGKIKKSFTITKRK